MGRLRCSVETPALPAPVGWALHQNPMPGVIPCHRVVNREGRMAPAFAFGGPEIQRGLLEEEGVPFLPDGRADLARALWRPSAREGNP